MVLAPIAAFLALGGCGSNLPPLLDEMADAARSDDTGPRLPHFKADSGEPSCETGPEGGVCGCLDLPISIDPPNLYFVLDRSGSMNESNKWNTVQLSIERLISELGPRVRFGAALFPDPASTDACAPGVEVAPLRRGDSPAGTQGPAELALLKAISVPAAGGTPTAVTFTELTPKLVALRGKTFAILATDGGPNCDGSLSCTSSTCTLNMDGAPGCPPGGTNCCAAPGGSLSCLDSEATLEAVSALHESGVSTFVIGVPGSEPYSAILDQLAAAGGTARSQEPFYYRVATTDQAAFYAALSRVAAKVTATCTLTLAMTPPDPSLINVYLGGQVLPQGGANGWSFAANTVTLLGNSCSRVLAGDVLDVRVVAGCPTVEK